MLFYLSLLLIALTVAGVQLVSYYSLQRLDTGVTSSKNCLDVCVLIDYGNGTNRWYNETNVAAGSNLYNFTISVAKVDASYSPQFNEHYVTGIDGVRDADPYFWTLWIYNQNKTAWTISFVGADLIKLGEGYIIAWFYQNISSGRCKPPGPGPSVPCV
jgi:hypothetical protein